MKSIEYGPCKHSVAEGFIPLAEKRRQIMARALGLILEVDPLRCTHDECIVKWVLEN